jgi:hypothetical protein
MMQKRRIKMNKNSLGILVTLAILVLGISVIPGVVAQTCTDTDGGVDYYAKGTCTDSYGRNATDVCDMGTLTENYCSSTNECTYDLRSCLYGCQDGACIKGITITSPNGGEKWTRGNTYDITWESSGINKVNIYLKDDSIGVPCTLCVENVYCPPCGATKIASNISAAQGKYSWTIPSTQSIGSKYKILIWDAAYPVAARDQSDNYFSIISDTCIDSDGMDYYRKGTCWPVGADKGTSDVCVDENTLWEWHCGAEPYHEKVCIYTAYKCPYGCRDGACISEVPECYDSDGGKRNLR